ncbi:Gldg family protein [Arhodomonas sp. AD133]|uniref:Gldg family protein n=1 Tax=Arhodomonas sp. AD133 TaxID=3415009 RepID=UPI003EB8CA3F
MRALTRVFRQEAGAYFSSPVAYLFIGTFLAVTLFIFFWAEAFFARNIADVRPLFEWMPILLIALVAALTMRAWSEERRSGTVEVLMTAPVPSLAVIGGKFLAALSLVAVAMLLTLPLALTAEFLGPLDRGPVIGGYVATLFLAAAYVAIGLFVSSRTSNQIVSLIVTVLIGAGLYLLGSEWLTALAPPAIAEVMRLVGTGSRFEAITRGVLDLRDVYYYVSLVGLFLALNVYSLEKLRWGGDRGGARHHVAWRTAVALVAVNFLVANLWLQPIAWARADITADNRYTLSSATDLYLSSLEEPLVIRGYFSRKTHPLLSPLVPQMQDLLQEYAVRGGDRVNVAFVHPKEDSEAISEASQRYGIEPVPLQTASRYESSVVNAYFNVLVKYGDNHVVLGLDDLVDIKGGPGGDVQVALRNPEYEITNAIREVIYQWRSGGDLLARLDEPVTFKGYISADERLPDKLVTLRKDLERMLETMQKESSGKLEVEFADPQADGGKLAERLRSEYGFRPLTTSLLGNERFYFHMVLQQGERTVPVELPSKLEKADLRKALEAGLKRFGDGFTKTVAVYQPSPGPRRRFGMSGGPSYRTLMQTLRENAEVVPTDLSKGDVPADSDLLLVLSPKDLDEKQRFAIDQFLMRGGTVIVAGSPMQVRISRRAGVQANSVSTGLEDWLAGYGIKVEDRLVLDPQSGALTLPTRSSGGGLRMQTLDYPYFVDIRQSGLADLPMLRGLNQVTMAWSSPVSVDSDEAGDLDVTPLVHSSARAWTSDATDVLPDYQRHPERGFAEPESRGEQTLAVMAEGRFTSAFKDRESPLATSEENGDESNGEDTKNAKATKANDNGEPPTVTSVIEHSPSSARLVVFGSGNFLSDSALDITAQSNQTRYRQPVQLVQNLVDWSLEDPAMLSIRGRSQYSRLLRPVSDGTRTVLEATNYAAGLGGLFLIFGIHGAMARRRRRWFERILNKEEG